MNDAGTHETQTQTLGFQAEVKQLLKLMIHSLYSHKEIFLRELISNASDALDKLRFEALSKPELLEGGGELAISIAADPKAHTITITDNGIGMSRQEAIEHLGTIAKSGTAEFLSRLTGDQKKDAQRGGEQWGLRRGNRGEQRRRRTRGGRYGDDRRARPRHR